MDKQTFNRFRSLVYDKAGIFLHEGKEALIQSRLGKRMRALGIDTHKQYLDFVIQDNTGEEIVQMLDAISTNVTSFFRESKHFDVLSELLHKWSGSGQKNFKFWSAACSSGEEPYSMAMVINDALGSFNSDYKILATDISTRVLEKSQQGIYDKEKLQQIPPKYRERFFERHSENGTTHYIVKDALKKIISFRRINLSTTPFPMKGPFDVVFCRNVMIYFDNIVRKNLLDEVHRLLKPGGYLMVGHAESLTGMMSTFKSVMPSVYVKV